MTDERSVGRVVGGVVIDWYRSSLGRDVGTARTTRARLRRCQSPVEALAVDETHDLHNRLKELDVTPTADQLALLATTFARLKGLDGDALAGSFGKKSTKDGPPMLGRQRFQSLIRVRSRRELMAPLRRSLAVLGPDPSCNGWALAEDLFFWNDRVRNNWCFQYFGAEFARGDQEETAR